MAKETVAFISYARADGKPFADQLRQRLQSERGITLWQDLTRMSTGDFEQQIKDAIDSSQYLVLISTPAALRSEWVEKEWRYAREQGVCICPIKPTFEAAVELEWQELHGDWPLWMRNIQVFDFANYWERFVNVLKNPCQATRSPYQARSLPPDFVKRPAESEQIIDCLLNGGRKDPSGKRVVLYGTAGFGKTSLAMSVSHDEDVFAACDGGILWATLGADKNPQDELTAIYAALTGERPQFATLDDARVSVAQKLAGKRCLMVIDDVWQEDRLAPFLQGGPLCSRLITTRLSDIAVKEASDESCRVNVAELEADQALEVLTARLRPPPALLPGFRRLAARLGEWPLLLQLANRNLLGQLAKRNTLEGALQWVNERYDEVGVVALDRENAIAKTVELSLSLLNEGRARCFELAAFPEDADIPLEWIAVVWQATAAATQRCSIAWMTSLSLAST